MKKAIILASFGTTYRQAREKALDRLEADIRQAYPGHDIFQAYTSKIVRQRVQEAEGLSIPNPGDLLENLVAKGYKEIYIQPSHLIHGKEFKKLYMYQKRLKDASGVKVKIGKPLLDSQEDFEAVVDILGQLKAESQSDGLVIMAHGTDSHAFTSYMTLKLLLKDRGIYMGCVEGDPDFSALLEDLKADPVESLDLMPLMMVAGDHCINDMASDDEDSWKSQLQQAGYQVTAIVKGLGEYEPIRKIYLSHLKQAIEGKPRCKHAS